MKVTSGTRWARAEMPSLITSYTFGQACSVQRKCGVGAVDKLNHGDSTVFQSKGSYEDQELTKYKSLRVKLHHQVQFFFVFLFLSSFWNLITWAEFLRVCYNYRGNMF